MSNVVVSWFCQPFNELTTNDLYNIIQLRNAVFVVEQNCVYQDADGRDTVCYHLFGKADNELVAYARLVPPGVAYVEPAIGRVVVDAAWRNKSLGKQLMEQSIAHCQQLFPGHGIRVSAQTYLKRFYTELGFLPTGKEYLEDGIPHMEMLLT